MCRRIGLIVTAALLVYGGFGIGDAQGQQVPVVPGPLTADAPFGICPVTNAPRTPADFYQLFGYLPEPYASQYKIRNTPPRNWPTTYYTPGQNTSTAPRAIVGPTGRVETMAPGTRTTAPSSSRTNGSNSTPPPKNTLPSNVGSQASNAGRAPSAPPAVSQPPIPAPRNSPLAKSVAKLTPENVQEMNRQLQAQQSKLLDDLSKRAAGNPQAQQAIQKLRESVQSGNVTGQDVADVVRAVQTLPAAEREAAMNDLAKLATNQQVANWLNGNTTGAAGMNAAGVAAAGSGIANPGMARNPNDPGTGGRLGASNVVGGPGTPNPARGTGVAAVGADPRNPNPPGPGGLLGMNNAAGGAGPRGGGLGGGVNVRVGPVGVNVGPGGGVNVAIGLIPALPRGMMIPMGGGGGGGGGGGWGGGPMLMGMGQPGDQILMGTGDPALAAGLPVAPPLAEPADDASALPAAGDVILRNAWNEAVSYSINQNPYSMKPDERQTMPAGQTWLVEFDRGNGRGTVQYELGPGCYRFEKVDDAWDVKQEIFTTTLDNAGNPTPFSFVLDNQPQTLEPDQTQELTNIYPPLIRFDNGAGQTLERSLEGKRYRVAFNQDQTLDIFPADVFTAAAGGRSDAGSAIAASGTAASSPTTSIEPATSATAETVVAPPPGVTLPPGFRMFDAAEALSNPEVGLSLPPDFDLFRSTALAMQTTGESK